MIQKLFGFLLLLVSPFLSPAQYFGEELPKPSSWAFGFKIANSQLDADISSKGLGRQGGIFFEKTLTRIVDLRLEAQIGANQGLNLFASTNHQQNNSLNGSLDPSVAYDSSAQFFHNYKHSYMSLGVSARLNINRMITVLGAEKWDLYVLGGLGAYVYHTQVNALNKYNRTYDFPSAYFNSKNRLQERLNDLMDNTYETQADQDFLNSTVLGSSVLKSYFITGGGLRFQLSEKFGLGSEFTYQFLGDDLLDGQQWQEDGSLSTNRDKLLSMGLLFDIAF